MSLGVKMSLIHILAQYIKFGQSLHLCPIRLRSLKSKIWQFEPLKRSALLTAINLYGFVSLCILTAATTTLTVYYFRQILNLAFGIAFSVMEGACAYAMYFCLSESKGCLNVAGNTFFKIIPKAGKP